MGEKRRARRDGREERNFLKETSKEKWDEKNDGEKRAKREKSPPLKQLKAAGMSG